MARAAGDSVKAWDSVGSNPKKLGSDVRAKSSGNGATKNANSAIATARHSIASGTFIFAIEPPLLASAGCRSYSHRPAVPESERATHRPRGSAHTAAAVCRSGWLGLLLRPEGQDLLGPIDIRCYPAIGDN